MRKCAGLLLIFLCLSLLFSGSVHAVSDDQIEKYTMEITVDGKGCCQITATAQVHFAASPKEFYFPLNAHAGSISTSGAEYDITSRNGVDYALFSSSAGFSGDHTFVCTYSLPCMVSETTDEEDEPAQELHIDLLPGGFDYRIMNFSLVLRSPVDIPVQPTWNSAFHRDLIDNYLTIQVAGKELNVNSVEFLRDGETVDMSLLFPTKTFTIVHEAGRTRDFAMYAFFVTLLLAVIYWYRSLRSKLLFSVHCTSTVSEATAGELPCQLFGRGPDVAAILAHWGNLGYLTIHRAKNGRLILTKQMEMGNERSGVERRLFSALFPEDHLTCDAGSRRFYRICDVCAPALQGMWAKRSFRPDTGNPKLLRGLVLLAAGFVSLGTFDALLPPTPIRWVLLPILCLMGMVLCGAMQFVQESFFHRHRLLCLLCGLLPLAAMLLFAFLAETLVLMAINVAAVLLFQYLTIYGAKRTHSGEELVRQLLGLRRSLAKFDQQDALQRLDNDSQYFYRMLPYADNLGVGRAFTKQFHGLTLESCPWLSDASFTPRTPSEFYKLYDNLMTSIRTEPKGMADRVREVLGHKR